MAEQVPPREPAPQYSETNRPDKPPRSVLQPEARTKALRTYVGGIVALFLIVAAALAYWVTADPVPDSNLAQPDTPPVGTAGQESPGGASPGGFDPAPRPDSTREELERRGAGEPAQGPMPPLTAGRPLDELGSLFENPSAGVGRRIELSGAEVERVESDGAFWVKDGSARAQVIAPRGTAPIEAGDRVDIRGQVEGDGSGGVRIRATGIEVR